MAGPLGHGRVERHDSAAAGQVREVPPGKRERSPLRVDANGMFALRGKRDACPTSWGYTPLMATELFAHPSRVKSESRDGSGHYMSARNRHLVVGQPSRLSPGQRAGQARRLSYEEAPRALWQTT
jgi:hypothetical protein